MKMKNLSYKRRKFYYLACNEAARIRTLESYLVISVLSSAHLARHVLWPVRVGPGDR
jgi:hypothetical protein